jgi:hypothetical protein
MATAQRPTAMEQQAMEQQPTVMAQQPMAMPRLMVPIEPRLVVQNKMMPMAHQPTASATTQQPMVAHKMTLMTQHKPRPMAAH